MTTIPAPIAVSGGITRHIKPGDKVRHCAGRCGTVDAIYPDGFATVAWDDDDGWSHDDVDCADLEVAP